MIAWIYKVLLTINSTLLMMVVFWANMQTKIILCFPKWGFVIGICVIILVLSKVSLFFCKFLSEDSVEVEIKELEAANSNFLPTYLGYFFVALSVSDIKVMIFVYSVVFVFTFISQAMYYNPILLCFGYQFYHITTEQGAKCFIITKRKLWDKRNLCFPKLRRINAMTYIDMEN